MHAVFHFVSSSLQEDSCIVDHSLYGRFWGLILIDKSKPWFAPFVTRVASQATRGRAFAKRNSESAHSNDNERMILELRQEIALEIRYAGLLISLWLHIKRFSNRNLSNSPQWKINDRHSY